mgnify:CR=1 FL=1
MGTIISIIVGVIAIFAFLSYIATPKGEDAEENAKAGVWNICRNCWNYM